MASNINKVSGYIAKKLAAEVSNEVVFLHNINDSYKEEFDTKINKFKVGETIKIAKPGLMTSIDGAVDGNDITGKFKEIQEEYVDVTVNCNPIIGTTISDKDAIFSLAKPGAESAWGERVIKPVSKRLAADVERKALELYTNSSDQVEVLETAPAAGYRGYFKKLNAKLSASRAPVGERYAIVNTDMANELTSEQEGWFAPSADIATAYSEAKIGMYGGMAFATQELVVTRTNGCGGNTLTLAADYVEGSTSIQVTSGSGVVVGDKIEFGFNSVGQQLKQDTGKAAVRAITAVVGEVLTISPMYFDGSELQNVDAASLVTGATATGLGTAGSKYVCFPVYQKEAFIASYIKLPPLGALDKINAVGDVGKARIRIFSGDDINTGASKQRAECMAAFAAIRPEWCGVLEVKSTLL